MIRLTRTLSWAGLAAGGQAGHAVATLSAMSSFPSARRHVKLATPLLRQHLCQTINRRCHHLRHLRGAAGRLAAALMIRATKTLSWAGRAAIGRSRHAVATLSAMSSFRSAPRHAKLATPLLRRHLCQTINRRFRHLRHLRGAAGRLAAALMIRATKTLSWAGRAAIGRSRHAVANLSAMSLFPSARRHAKLATPLLRRRCTQLLKLHCQRLLLPRRHRRQRRLPRLCHRRLHLHRCCLRKCQQTHEQLRELAVSRMLRARAPTVTCGRIFLMIFSTGLSEAAQHRRAKQGRVARSQVCATSTSRHLVRV